MPPMTITEIEAARAEYQPSDIEREFALSNPRPRTPDRRTTVHDDRRATAEERRLLHRFGSPVPLEPAGSDADGRGEFRLPIDNAVRPSAPPPAPRPRPIRPAPPAKPAAITPPVVPGVLPREVRLGRPARSVLEEAAQGCYTILTHEARVLLRLLDHAMDATTDRRPRQTLSAVPWSHLVEAFTLPDQETWEPIAALWRAVDELIEAQVACIIPGAQAGVQVLFISERCHRQMLRSRVLTEPHSIDLTRFGSHYTLLCRQSLRPPAPCSAA